MRSVDERIGRAVARWVAGVDRRPGLLLAVVGALTLGLGAYAATHLGVDSSPDAMVRDDLPFRVNERRFEQTFRDPGNEILLVIDGETASAAGKAADALAARLAAREDLFDLVDVVGGGEFFDRNALLYLEPPELESFVDRLAAVQPFLAEVGRDASVVGISDLLTQAVEAGSEGTDVGLDLAGALDRVTRGVEAAVAGRGAPDPWGDALIGGSLSENARHRVVSASPIEHFDELLGAEAAIRAVREAVDALGYGPGNPNGVRVRVTGTVPLNHDELLVLQRQGVFVGVASFVLFTAAMFFGLRKPRSILALTGSLVASLVWTNAFAAAAVGHMNQVSVAFNVLVIGLGGELGIHFSMRYLELLGQGRPRAIALPETGSSVGSSLVSSAGTTAIGFLVFLPTDYRGVAQLGLISGAGVLLSLLSTFTVLPALLALGAPERPAAPSPALPWAARLRHLPVAFARPIRWAALALGAGSLLLLPEAHFDHNPVNLRDPSTESVQAMNDLLARTDRSPWTVDAIAPDLAAAEALAERMRRLPPVARAVTLADFVPKQQDEKLALLADAAFFAPPTVEPAPPPSEEAQRAALERLEESLARAGGRDAELAGSARRLAAALAALREELAGTPDAGPLLALVRRNVVGTLPEQLGELRRALSAAPVTLADLPRQLTQVMLAPDGRARVQVFAKRDLSDSAALTEFVDAVTALAPDASGNATRILGFGRVTSDAMQQALFTGLACMALFLFLLWRSVRDILLAFFPLALAAALTCAAMVLLGMSFNFANVIVLPMLLGMGIDNGVHLVHRHRTNPGEVDVLSTSTARAVFYAALTTVLCFGALAFAPHRGMAALGRMLSLGVAATLLCYVVVLPAVLDWDDRRRGRRGRVPEPAGALAGEAR
jgi:hopanoid biosynthesis associated RND transporter like protein HpnN